MDAEGQGIPLIGMKSTIGEVKSSATWSAPWMMVRAWCSSSWSSGSPPENISRGFASVFSHLILVTGRQPLSPSECLCVCVCAYVCVCVCVCGGGGGGGGGGGCVHVSECHVWWMFVCMRVHVCEVDGEVKTSSQKTYSGKTV